MAEKLSEAQRMAADAEKSRLKLFAAERARTTREKYEIKEISGWMYIGPSLGLVAGVIIALIMYMSHTNLTSEHLWFFGLVAAPLVAIAIASEINGEWEATLSAKYELSHQLKPDGSYFSELQQPYYDYKFDYIYTDSLFSSVGYQFAKICSVIYTLAVGVAIAILLFLWLGTISVAPTTIIIILLLVIIFNQSSR